MLGGLAGAKLLWVFEHLGEEPVFSLLFSRGGLSWFGGFAGGVLAGLVVMHRKRLPKVPVLAAATPALAAGHAIGRIGCFLVGDDYGRPTSLPWGVAFPEGLPPTTVPVHPTQLYEAAALVPLVLLLLRCPEARRLTVVRARLVPGAGGCDPFRDRVPARERARARCAHRRASRLGGRGRHRSGAARPTRAAINIAAPVACHAAFGGFAAFGRVTTRRRHDDNDVVIATGHEVTSGKSSVATAKYQRLSPLAGTPAVPAGVKE